MAKLKGLAKGLAGRAVAQPGRSQKKKSPTGSSAPAAPRPSAPPGYRYAPAARPSAPAARPSAPTSPFAAAAARLSAAAAEEARRAAPLPRALSSSAHAALATGLSDAHRLALHRLATDGSTPGADSLLDFLRGKNGETALERLRSALALANNPAATPQQRAAAATEVREIQQTATTVYKANVGNEARAVSALPPHLRSLYEWLKALFSEPPPPDLFALLHLMSLLLEGKLSPELLKALTALGQQPLGEGMSARELLAGAVADLAAPGKIIQHDDTCAAVNVATLLAMTDPLEYLQLLSGLASPAGEAQLKGGRTLRRMNVPDDDTRWLSQRLMAPALMNASVPDGLGLHYDAMKGRFANAGGEPVDRFGNVVAEEMALRGVPLEWHRELLSQAHAIAGRSLVIGRDATADITGQALGALAEAARRDPVSVILKGRGIEHAVTVTGVNADGSFRVLDPLGAGEEQFFTADELAKRLAGFLYLPGQLSPATERSMDTALRTHLKTRSPQELLAWLLEELDITSGGNNNTGGGTVDYTARSATLLASSPETQDFLTAVAAPQLNRPGMLKTTAQQLDALLRTLPEPELTGQR